MAVDSGAPDYEGGGLSRETNWWGAFVIGLAGTILVTGIAPVMVTSLGAASIPVMVVITITGYLLCLLPRRALGDDAGAHRRLSLLRLCRRTRTGGRGSPSTSTGSPSWAYWLGWFPVAPLNMILASFYITEKFNLSQKGFTPIHTPIAYWTIVISVVGILLVFIPAWLGIRLGAMFATVLGLLSMIPADAACAHAVPASVRRATGATSPASTSCDGTASSRPPSATAGSRSTSPSRSF